MTVRAVKVKRFRKIMLWSLIALIVLVVIIVIGISVYAAFSMTRFERKPIEKNPSDFGLDYDSISFDSKDELKLKGWWLEGSKDNQVVVMVHGSEGNRARPPEKMIVMAGEFVEHGYSVLMFDLRGHGESEAKHVSAGLYEKYDVLGAIDYVKNRGMRRIGVIGFSLGAATSLMAVSESYEIDAVVSDSGYADLTDIIRSEFKERSSLPQFFIPIILSMTKLIYSVDFSAVRPIDAAQKATIPIFIIHGAQDTMVPVEHAYRLAGVLQNPDSQYWIVPDAGHSNPYLVEPGEYMKKVLSFFDKVFE